MNTLEAFLHNRRATRAIGRSTRLLQQAVHLLRNGERMVWVVCDSAKHIRVMRHMLEKIATAFPATSSISFETVEGMGGLDRILSRLHKPVPGNPVLVDHFALEARIEPLLEMLHRFDAAEPEDRKADKARAIGAPASDPASTQIRPRVVCLCGSTRFMDAFRRANLTETLAGRIVLTVGCDTKSDTDLMLAGILTDEAKARLDELHKRKIDLADEILVLNVGGYVGESTRSEIIYADRLKKPIRWLEPMACPCCKGRGGCDTDEDSIPCALCHGSGRVSSGIRDQASGIAKQNNPTANPPPATGN